MMKVFQLSDPQQLRLRAHPWVDAESDSGCRYLNLREHPELIRTSLEDLVPWCQQPAIERFFQLLEWLNSDESLLESNDCAFSGPSVHQSPFSERKLEVSGRLMVLFQEVELNTLPGQLEALTQHIGGALTAADHPSLQDSVIGVSVVDVLFTELSVPKERQLGKQLMLSFWAWGDDETQVFSHLEHTVKTLHQVLVEVVSRFG